MARTVTFKGKTYDVIDVDTFNFSKADIGLFSAGVARASGATQIFLTGIEPFRLNIGKQMGADRVINVREENAIEVVKAATGGLGADVVFTDAPDGDALTKRYPNAQVRDFDGDPQRLTEADALIAYRSNPHLDQRQRGLDAGRLMARTVRGEVRPRSVLQQIPVLPVPEAEALAPPSTSTLSCSSPCAPLSRGASIAANGGISTFSQPMPRLLRES